MSLAPCRQQTPPLADWFAHPSELHGFFLAPWVPQMPPRRARLSQPSMAHFLYHGPCLVHTPPSLLLWDKLMQPSTEQV
eukprot:CAMPEP_0172577188 /NCGR_PEP_ID=MMETSP1067-20121228/138107_1 /TAXON_ID=265564 ORGANISM="Thalassiosira punctigera, Strain Tpunct2005C2" /NCGR_SAMPLE_ID=MMETSP1067 /ASSEMBLY_ACC=CAM_ASM_000444 /LENGTH=78 /DNA_ID=CAMNT_0013369873 /DNA_START=801 /DNA_END=1037 /DNA_ORIENTATION=-